MRTCHLQTTGTYINRQAMQQKVNVEDTLWRWSQNYEYRNIPQDRFVEIMLAAQKDSITATNALRLCHMRYDKDSPPPSSLLEVLLKTQTGSLPNHQLCGYWIDVALLYLDKHKIQVKDRSTLLLQAARAHYLQDILDKMLKTKPVEETWKAFVLAVKKADRAHLIALRFGLRKCKDYFKKEGVIELIHEHIETRDPKYLAPRVAYVLPNDLSVAMKWMSLCEKQKTDVAVRLLDNMLSHAGEPLDVDDWQSRLDEATKAMQKAPKLVNAWLSIYRASVHGQIAAMLWDDGNDTFKIGFVETLEEKKYRDSLETWLEDPNINIYGKGKLLHTIRTDRELGGRRKDGHIWHAALAKVLYESHLFKSVGVECEVDGKTVDILLEDELAKNIHIEAWDGMTETSHGMRRMLQTGEVFDINKLGRSGDGYGFDWKYANKWLNGKFVSGSDLIIEVVPENMDLKRTVYAELDDIAAPDTIFASNTSTLPITKIADATNRKNMVVGVHFFNPPQLMKLVEIIPGSETSKDIVDLMQTFVSSLGKTPVVCRQDVPGFIVNRLFIPMVHEALYVMDRHHNTQEEIDSAVKFEMNFPMGIFELADFTGIDVIHKASVEMSSRDQKVLRQHPAIKEMFEEGKLGQKTGEGFYKYSDDKYERVALSKELANQCDPLPLVANILNNAAWLITHKASDPQEIEKAVKLGLGLKRPLFETADMVGIQNVVSRLNSLAASHGSFYEPDPYLLTMTQQ